MSDTTIQVTLIQQHDYRFDIHFGGEVPIPPRRRRIWSACQVGSRPRWQLCAVTRRIQAAPGPIPGTVEGRMPWTEGRA